MDGPAFARAVHDRKDAAPLPLVLLSSDPSGAASSSSLFAAVLTKPVATERLRECLTQVFRASSRRLVVRRTRPPIAKVPRRQGRVLVADDNAVNREVTSEFLKELGYEVEIAVDGKEALAAARSKTYAAILMDCQMPEMNGYDATRELRGLEAGRRTPIIAVTAHAMAGERERVLASGMDDYLSKPLNVDALAAVMDRWVSDTKESSPKLAAVGERQGPETLSPRTRRSPRVIGLFLEDLPRRLSLVRASVASTDGERTKDEAHSLKGSSLSIGAGKLAEALAALEASPDSDAHATLEKIEKEAEAVRYALLAELAPLNIASGHDRK
jgi:two-component system sensor histidine kinase/response regulator